MTGYKGDLQVAIRKGDIQAVSQLFEASDLESNEYNGSLLHYAANRGTLQVVQFLVDNGADLKRRGGTYDAPAITYAADKGNLEITRFLTNAGSPIDTSNALRNPLLRAANEGHVEIVKFLLTTDIDRHASYRLPSGKVINALSEAESGPSKEAVEVLKAAGCVSPTQEEEAEKSHSDSVLEFMESRFGPADSDAIHELLPEVEGMSIAINIIQPNELHPYYVLFTNGMSERPMNVPDGQEDWQRAELVIHLPKEWVHPKDANSDERWMWPIKWLRQMAYYPHSNDTWLGRPAAILSSAEPPEPLGPNLKQTCLFMVPDFANLDPPLQNSDGQQVHFFTLVPLFTEERDFELQHGMKAFLERFSESRVPMIVDLERKSFVA